MYQRVPTKLWSILFELVNSTACSQVRDLDRPWKKLPQWSRQRSSYSTRLAIAGPACCYAPRHQPSVNQRGPHRHPNRIQIQFLIRNRVCTVESDTLFRIQNFIILNKQTQLSDYLGPRGRQQIWKIKVCPFCKALRPAFSVFLKIDRSHFLLAPAGGNILKINCLLFL